MVVYLILYGAGMLFASSAHYYMSGMSLILAALYLYFYDYRRSGNPLHLRALFSLFWVGGEGISCFKLSRLQTDWDPVTWIKEMKRPGGQAWKPYLKEQRLPGALVCSRPSFF